MIKVIISRSDIFSLGLCDGFLNLNDLNLLENNNFDVQSIMQRLLTYIQNFLNMFISNLFNFTIGITNFIMNLFLGIIISMYILLSKEKLIFQFKKFILLNL